MSSNLRPDDRALAAYLLGRDALTLPELRRALEALDSTDAGPTSLEEALVDVGVLDATTVEYYARQARGQDAPRPSPGLPTADEDAPSVEHPWSERRPQADTLYDIPALEPGAMWGGTAAKSVHEPEETDDLEVTHPQLRALGRAATQPRPPARPSGVDVDLGPSDATLSPSGLKPGQRYRVLDELGRGGMGQVLEARDEEIGRAVAMKVFLPPKAGRDLAARRFWTEVRATGQLEHPSIIPIHDVGRTPEGELFYVMKKLTGRTLADIMRAIRAKDPGTTEEFGRVRLLTAFQQIAYAVAFAHARGVIHRDIKPGNIMIGRFGEAILIDWGLAKVMGERVDPDLSDDLPLVDAGPRSGAETAAGTITGTPQYMSPEATEGDPSLIGDRSDVYGLGAVLYEILANEPAFKDQGFMPTVMQVREGKVAKPRVRRPDLHIPVELEELCASAMALEPGDRPSAKELADDLGRILEGARERERRQRELRARLSEGRKAADRWKVLKLQLQQVEAEAKRLRKSVPPWAGLQEKHRIWSAEDRASELQIDAISAFEEAEAAFLRALGEVSDDRDARNALASLYFARFGEAERARDTESQRYYRRLVSRYDDGAWAPLLEGTGTLEVSSPETLSVSVAQLCAEQRVLRPGALTELGQTPTERRSLGPGSYLIYARTSEDAAPAVVPILMGRTDELRLQVLPRTRDEVGEGFVWIPGGPAIIGGDPIAHGAHDRQVLDVPEFAIARFPVTCGEYQAFLDGIAANDPEQARLHAPRARAREGYYWDYDEGRRVFSLPEVSPTGHRWTEDLPVNGISAEDALAYAAWFSTRTGVQVRLPTENEWEKAARGVDGRFFPWGDEFDPNFCKMKDSRASPYPEPEPVGAFPIDCSVYGARDMAGGIRELCWGLVDGDMRPVMRGGCWHDTGLFCRVAFRHVTSMDFVNTGLGFRLAKDLG